MGRNQVSQVQKTKGRGFIKLLLFAGILVVVISVVRLSGLHVYLDQQKLQTWIKGYGALGPVIYILIYLIAPALFLPGLPITLAGGVLFGPIWGVVYTIIGATAGCTVAFLIARYLGRKWVGSKVEGTKLEKLDQEVERQGWKIVAFTRLIPLFPFNLLNYAFGLTRIRIFHYIIASFIFMLPGCIAYIVFGSSLLDLFKGEFSFQLILGIFLVILVSLIPIYHKKHKIKKGEGGYLQG